MTYVVVLVAVPMLALAHYGLADGASVFWASVTTPMALAALKLTFWTSLLVASLDAVLGTATAWVLIRGRLPGRTLLSSLVDLPLAVPTLVAGIMLAVLYGPTSRLGRTLHEHGIEIVFAPFGIVLALLFVTLPFVVRAVEPVLLEVDPAQEEAAAVLGAGRIRTFRTVFLPAIAPAMLSGTIRALGRALGEFGAVVVVAGNIPFDTLTAPVFVFGEIESGAPRAAAAVSVVLLVAALALHALAEVVGHKAVAHGAAHG